MIAHFSSQLSGGGHIAGRRLHDALRRKSLESYFYYGSGQSPDPSVIGVFQNRSFFWRNLAALAISWRNRRQSPEGYINSPRWIRKTPLDAIGRKPQIINLHCVLKWLDIPSFCNSIPAGLPVVWTIHELTPITGGCTYPGDCDGFTRDCGSCPQQKRPGPRDATNKFVRIKQHWYQKLNLHLAGNSTWTTAQIRRSSLGKHAKSIRTIHLGIDPREFAPVDKALAKKALKLSEHKFVVGFACSDFNERRKGAEILVEALKSFPADKITLLLFGSGIWPRNLCNWETISLGTIGSARLQSLYYSALDVFAMPSLVETFGLVALEAMSCQTPVVAYPAGGLADVVENGETGLLESEIGSVSGVVRMLQWMWKHPRESLQMGLASRQRVVEKFSDSLMASRYTDLYQELVPAAAGFSVLPRI